MCPVQFKSPKMLGINKKIVILNFLILIANTHAKLVSLSFKSDLYETHVGSQNFTLTCTAQNMRRVDVVWMKYLLDNSRVVKAIYSDRKYIGHADDKYLVRIAEHSNDSLTTSLTIFNVRKEDLRYAYKCECNIYKRCSNTNRAKANATIREVPFVNKLIAQNISGTNNFSGNYMKFFELHFFFQYSDQCHIVF